MSRKNEEKNENVFINYPAEQKRKENGENNENNLSRRKISENNENNKYYATKVTIYRIKLVKTMKKVKKVYARTRRIAATFPPGGRIFLSIKRIKNDKSERNSNKISENNENVK